MYLFFVYIFPYTVYEEMKYPQESLGLLMTRCLLNLRWRGGLKNNIRDELRSSVRVDVESDRREQAEDRLEYPRSDC